MEDDTLYSMENFKKKFFQLGTRSMGFPGLGNEEVSGWRIEFNALRWDDFLVHKDF